MNAIATLSIAVAFFVAGVWAAEPPDNVATQKSRPTIERWASEQQQHHIGQNEQAPLFVRQVQTEQEKEDAQKRESQTDARESENSDSESNSSRAALSQAKASWLQLYISAIGTLIAIVGSIFLVRTYWETKRTADAARDSADTFMASERSNLAIESVALNGLDTAPDRMSIDDDDSDVCGRWILKNSGKSPARIVDISDELRILDALPETPIWNVREKSWIEIIPPGSGDWRTTYLPSGTPEYPEWRGNVDWQQYKRLEDRNTKIFLTVRVRYKDQFGRDRAVSGAWQGCPENTAADTVEWRFEPCGPRAYWEYS